jgi:AcrR family transcriptional regulator
MDAVAVEKWTRERRRQLTRSALVEAASHVFARRGFNGASLDEIAETAGFTRGAIYKHFDGKEDLLLAVWDQINERVLQAFADQLDEGTRAPLDAHAVATTWRKMIADNSDLFALELEFRLYELRNPSVRKRAVAHRRRNREMIAQFMRDHAPAAGITFKVDPDTLAGILLATSDGFTQAAQLDPRDASLYESFLELFLPAIAEDSGRSSTKPR